MRTGLQVAVLLLALGVLLAVGKGLGPLLGASARPLLLLFHPITLLTLAAAFLLVRMRARRED